MKRIRNAIAVLALTAAPLVTPATPAEASTAYVCAGSGELVMNAPLFYPTDPSVAPNLRPATNTTFSGTMGTCVGANASISTANVTGSINGHCLRGTGSVSINAHASASFQKVGTILVIAGGNVTVGVAVVVPAGGTCLNGAARFRMTGVVVTTG